MKLNLTPVEVPFMVGDTVWVNQFSGAMNQYPYFQGKIIQIILNGSLNNSTVIRDRRDIHELVISSGIYDLKPTGAQDGLPRVSVLIGFISPQTILFSTEKKLLDYQNALDSQTALN